MLEIDGSYGEGGGQILRTALSLSCLLQKPFRIYDIRKGRRKPGLMPQHLMAVRASAAISGASVKGDAVGSTELFFEPSSVKPGDYVFDIGTAGSTSLLAQTLLPPLAFLKGAGGASALTLKGGTHVPMSPPYHYLSEVFLPTLNRLGIDVRAEIDSGGFYPRGGGQVRFRITPSKEIKPASFVERGKLLYIKGVSAVGNLPLSIAARQTEAFLAELKAIVPDAQTDIENTEVKTFGRGTFIFIAAHFENSVAGFSALGERGKRAEAVGMEAAREFIEFYKSGACLDRHMADQILLYLSLAGGASRFTAERITGHLRTNLWVIEKFLPVSYKIDEAAAPPTICLYSLPQGRA